MMSKKDGNIIRRRTKDAIDALLVKNPNIKKSEITRELLASFNDFIIDVISEKYEGKKCLVITGPVTDQIKKDGIAIIKQSVNDFYPKKKRTP